MGDDFDKSTPTEVESLRNNLLESHFDYIEPLLNYILERCEIFSRKGQNAINIHINSDTDDDEMGNWALSWYQINCLGQNLKAQGFEVTWTFLKISDPKMKWLHGTRKWGSKFRHRKVARRDLSEPLAKVAQLRIDYGF